MAPLLFNFTCHLHFLEIEANPCTSAACIRLKFTWLSQVLTANKNEVIWARLDSQCRGRHNALVDVRLTRRSLLCLLISTASAAKVIEWATKRRSQRLRTIEFVLKRISSSVYFRKSHSVPYFCSRFPIVTPFQSLLTIALVFFSFFPFFFFFFGKRKRTIDYAAVIDENNWDTRATSSRIKRLDHRISFLLLFSVISSSKPRFAFGIELDQRDIIYSSSADRARDSKFEN